MKDKRTPIVVNPTDYHPMSFGDPNARVFWREGKLYRGISNKRVRLYKRLFEDGAVQRLCQKGLLVDTEIANLDCNDYELVLQHRIVPFVSFAHEWCAPMLAAAALLVLNLQIELCQMGLSLQDGHPWNVLFDGSEPLFVDFGSIVPAPAVGLWPAYDEFCRFFMYPLQLMAHGHDRIARWLLHDDEAGVRSVDLDALTTLSFRAKMRSFAKGFIPHALRPILKRSVASSISTEGRTPQEIVKARVTFLKKARADIEAVAVAAAATESTDDDDGAFPEVLPSGDWNAKQRGMYEILSAFRPRTLLDVGHNRGWYSQLAARLGASVVAFDADERCVAQLYREAKSARLRILPLVMDIRNPSPGYGVCNVFAPASDRFSCEMVIALALVHRLVFTRRLNFEQVAASLSAFSTKWLVVEFVPAHDQDVQVSSNEDRAWYTLEGFRQSLSKHFRTTRVLPSFPEPRVLVLCEK